MKDKIRLLVARDECRRHGCSGARCVFLNEDGSCRLRGDPMSLSSKVIRSQGPDLGSKERGTDEERENDKLRRLAAREGERSPVKQADNRWPPRTA